jgi:hypothetical protein
MPSFAANTPKYTASRKNIVDWNTHRRGLNLLLRPTELRRDELAQADNILLKGSGVPTGRWGTSEYFTVGSSGLVRGVGTFVKDTTNEIFALSDDGYIEKKNGLLSTRIDGQSWPSGSVIRTEQLGGETYIVSKDVPFTKYSGSSFITFVTVPAPTGLYATNISGVSGTNRISYKILATTPNGGHTEPSANYVLSNLPSDLNLTSIALKWNHVSAPTLSGYELYKGREGDETFYTALPSTVNSYVDASLIDPAQTITPPLTNTTGGLKSEMIKRYQNRLLMVQGSTLFISAKYPDHSSFSLMDGGGTVDIDPDTGDDITGIEVQPIADRIVVYKNRSSYLVKLDFVSIGPFYLLDPSYQPISTAVGCSSPDTVATVENDSFYFGRDGIYVTGYEPNFLNIIRTNEVSARIKPYFEKLSAEDYATACAIYVDNKYILSFPRLREMVVYDRERGSFAGIWKLPYGISSMKKYYDDSGTEHWVLGSADSNKVYEFVRSINSDDGTAIIKTLRTNKEDFGDWTKISTIEFFYSLFRAITGSVTVNIIIEDRNGNNLIVKTFTITGAEVSGLTGWGTDAWGTIPWGDTGTDEYSVSLDEVPKWGTLFKQARSVQIEVSSSSTDSNFELLALNMRAKTQQSGVLASSQRV